MIQKYLDPNTFASCSFLNSALRCPSTSPREGQRGSIQPRMIRRFQHRSLRRGESLGHLRGPIGDVRASVRGRRRREPIQTRASSVLRGPRQRPVRGGFGEEEHVARFERDCPRILGTSRTAAPLRGTACCSCGCLGSRRNPRRPVPCASTPRTPPTVGCTSCPGSTRTRARRTTTRRRSSFRRGTRTRPRRAPVG